jgi:hypothetical protein
MQRIAVLFLQMGLLTLSLSACTTHLPTVTHPLNCSVLPIAAAPGPEDIALVPFTTNRLLISSVDRRQATSTGDIYLMDTISRRLNKMQRTNEPAGFLLRPHGLDTVRLTDSKDYLFVVAHGPGKTNYDWHKIVQYEIIGSQLRYVRSFTGPNFISPNDVAVDPQGTLIFSNDGTKHWFSALLNIKRGSVERYAHQQWQTMVKDLIYANGVLMHDHKVYIADAKQNQIMQYDISDTGNWHNPRLLTTVPMPDNLSLSGDWLYTAGHLSTPSLIRHFLDRSGKNFSPSALYRINIHTGETQILFASHGDDISALSGAQVSGNVLIASAIFDAKLLVCDLPKGWK